ncbi:hypothetical protein MUP77_04980, partial [Candidatus Bathyarchaeota archaeon]|nr:hypothetical protein [Candidatus Bathyarchaeota archaeon]
LQSFKGTILFIFKRELKLDIKLKTIPEPVNNTRVVFDASVGTILPVIKGNGDVNLLCGNCGSVLAEGINQGQIRNIVVHCPVCRFFNEIP